MAIDPFQPAFAVVERCQ